ncbi:prepilin peptidase [Neobacillus cucumis]|uniref:Prepilin peptidase n=1 Tax=Neobacillus cucumis TaxID=1740721 RepID=A0A2N5HN88_9BACI|nr:prepilin peptidase [Neobacillus cucumis]
MLLIVLVTILIVSLYTDIKSRRILNIITLPTIIIAFVFHTYTFGLSGLVFSSKGFLTGVGLLIIPFILGGLGAGDVKLMAAIGALMGTSFVFYSFIYTAIIGGMIGVFIILKTKGFRNSIKSLLINIALFRSNQGSLSISKVSEGKISFPYGIAIVLGTFCSLIWGG